MNLYLDDDISKGALRECLATGTLGRAQHLAIGVRLLVILPMTEQWPAVLDPTGKIQTFCDLKIRQKALHEALNPLDASSAGLHPDDLSVARSRRDRSD